MTKDSTSTPTAKKIPVSTTRHGETFIDNYAWLRDKADPAVREYLEAENADTDAVLAPTKEFQDVLYKEMLGRIKETDLSVPYRRGDWWYYTRTEEGKQYAIHCRKHGGMDGEEVVLLDVNVLAEGKSFMSLGSMAVSDDGWLLAYSTDDTGFRQYTLRIRDLRSGNDLPVSRERVTSVAWDSDNATLFFSIEHAGTKRSHQVHTLDVHTGESSLVYEEVDETMNVGVARSRSREWLLIESGSHTTSETRVRRAGSNSDWHVVLPRERGREYDVVHHSAHFYIRINDLGRNFRLVRVPVDSTTLASAEEVIPHRDDVMLSGHEAFVDHLVLHERERGLPNITIRQISDGASHRITFPEPTYECYPGANPEFETDTYRYGYQSMVSPMSVLIWGMNSRERTLLKQQEVLGGYDSTRFTSRRLEAPAADGTSIPISLVMRADLDPDTPAPCLLKGYGSYGYPYPVTFSSSSLSLLERGVVIAIAHIRGGGELGKPWHDAGKMAHKMNTFTDFIAVADQLADSGIVAGGRIAIEGGSAGGLLMGAVVNLAPERFCAVLSHVPFVDVINTMSDATLPLTVGEYEEWGNPNLAEEFAWMREYCPYTNLQPGSFPPMLVKTSLNDSQVMYWEPAKYVAKMREIRTNNAPLLLHTNLDAGHGGASGRYDSLHETAMDFAFLLAALGVEGQL